MDKWSTVLHWWNGLSPQIQAALIGTITTVLGATIAALVVVWQIGKQFQNAIIQARHSEVLKLHLEIYGEIVANCRDAIQSEAELTSDILLFEAAVHTCRSLSAAHLGYLPPKHRSHALTERKYQFDMAAARIISLIERWQIIDPRVEVFKIAVNVAQHDVTKAWNAYQMFVIPIMPMEFPDGPNKGAVMPWTVPNEKVTQELETKGMLVKDAVNTVGCYISDFQAEMQNGLLGELFVNKVPPRKPIDPRHVVVRLDRYEELLEYFDKETNWGRDKANIENQVKNSLAISKSPSGWQRFARALRSFMRRVRGHHRPAG